MSLDSLPACVKKCLQDAAKSAGCGINDVKCICTKDVSTSDGSTLMSCVISSCDTSDVISAGSDLVKVCAQATGTASPTGTTNPTALASTSGTTSPATTSATSTSTSTTTNSGRPDAADSTGSSTAPTAGAGPTGSGGLSTGAKAGIGVGAAVVVILLILGAYLLGRKKRRGAGAAVPAQQGSPESKMDAQVLSNEKPHPVTELEGARWVPELSDHGTHQVVELEAHNHYGQQPRY
ncbi:hypothetical protein PCL_04574 [Purpureocillium lilacinum]|uniref:CFEM domain-containing protein n=1 Tax=Purpureocillium lilacinum TaxID=33203 RepID=A0A2U3DXT1_PURLI|nr:hypothetical protein PCL_04574 [Purpureocillium lilacinum]